MSSRKKVIVKAVLLGDGGVGKTSLINRFMNTHYACEYKPTIGAEFFTKEITVDGKLTTLSVWDTAGQERFRSLSVSYYRGADVAILVYDITSATSFDALEEWRDEFLIQSCVRDPDNFPFIVIGNKTDAGDMRQVSADQLKHWAARNNNMAFIEASASSGENVDEAFVIAARKGVAFESNSATDRYVDFPDPIRLNAPTSSASTRSCRC